MASLYALNGCSLVWLLTASLPVGAEESSIASQTCVECSDTFSPSEKIEVGPPPLLCVRKEWQRGYKSAGSVLALDGWDVTSYHDSPAPLRGSPQWSCCYGAVDWLFADEARRSAFMADPTCYLPQYEGWCSWSLAHGKLVPHQPSYYKLLADRLYLFSSPQALKEFSANPETILSAAELHWRHLLEEAKPFAEGEFDSGL